MPEGPRQGSRINWREVREDATFVSLVALAFVLVFISATGGLVSR